jgi:DMSO reductase anchor subunit
MQPAFSVIFFTVASGAGLGLLAWLSLAELVAAAGVAAAPWLAPTGLVRASLLGLGLTVAGLLSSTLHLANPRNAWRSLARVRTSWLSREAAAALLLLAAATLQLGLLALHAGAAARAAAALAVVLLAWTVLLCTAMIYASLKPIRHWHTRWTPAAYLALGHWSGAVLYAALATHYGTGGAAPAIAAVAAGVVAAAVKLGYWMHAAGGVGSVTLESALGVDRGVRPPSLPAGAAPRARLLDVGHSHATFLTREFGFTAGGGRTRGLRALVWIAAFLLPLVWLVAGVPNARGALLAAVGVIIGLVAERWLFFAEARHTVRLFHGDART